MYSYCYECEGETYHAYDSVIRKSDDMRLETVTCDECETRTITKELGYV